MLTELMVIHFEGIWPLTKVLDVCSMDDGVR